MVVGMIQSAFVEGHLMEECTCQNVVLNPKGNSDFCSIRLVDVLRKMVMWIPNICLMAVIQFHDTLHIFCMGRGTGTSSL